MAPFDESDEGNNSFDNQSHDAPQAGVKRLEAISTIWSKTGLYIAYLGICLTAWATSLESQTTTNLTVYATSAFESHSLVSTVLVVQGVVLSVVKPPMSKVADVFGRFEAFTMSIALYVLGYIQQAASNSVKTYAAAQIFYSAGQTGLQILIQIFIADTSDLLNRALIVTLPDIPFLVNVWIGPFLADIILRNLNWRFGYGMWAIVLPISFLPLALALYFHQVKALRLGLLPPSPFEGKTRWQVVKSLWLEMDAFGLILLCIGFSLVLVPLTIGADSGWHDPGFLAMLALGLVCIIGFPFWESSKRFAPRAFFPKALWNNTTVLAGIVFAFFYFSAFYLSIFPYFQSYLLVVHDLSISSAGHIIQVFTFSATVTSILVSLGIKYRKRYRLFVTTGASIYLAGLILMVFVRTESSSITAIVGAQVMIGVGGGMCHGPAQLAVQASATHQEVASATAAFLTLLEIGGAVGSAISGWNWRSNIPRKLAEYLPDETKDQAGAIFGSIKLAANGWPMGDPTRVAINRAYQETMTQSLMFAVCMAAPCVFLSLMMKDYKLDELEQPVTGVVIGNAEPDTGLDHDEDRLSRESSAARLLGNSGDNEEEEALYGDNDHSTNNGSHRWKRLKRV
ncbi:MAG: hypothetical protein FE78DRAFT_140766 [Acidomyces sp. 'richmondensis']|nr:MAG: hypothetical protein FE78DRAFT_140766 [Acidomyces sp. 'richmondensis']